MKRYFTFNKKMLPILIVSGIAFIISLACKIAFMVLERNNIYFYTNKIFHDTQQNFLIIIMIISFCTGLFTFLNKKALKITLIVILVLVLVLFIIGSFIGGFLDSEKVYFTLTSPDKTQTLIIEECSWLLGGWTNVYLKTSNFFAKKLHSGISTDDGYRPFSSNDYQITWRNNSVMIEYGYGNEGIKKQALIDFS